MNLEQFEQIDALYARAAAAERVAEASGDYSREGYFRPIWALEAAVIDAIGYDAYSDYPSAQDAALDLIFDGLTGRIDIA